MVNFANEPLRSVPKPSYGRWKPKRGTQTRVTTKVRKEVDRRSMELMSSPVPCCEKCGYIYQISKAHMENASQGGTGRHPRNIANLCGTHGMVGTCHHWADNTPEGRRWKVRYAKKLESYYRDGNGKNFWKE